MRSERFSESQRQLLASFTRHPLPGAPAYDGQAVEEIYEFAVGQRSAIRAGGMDGVIVESTAIFHFSNRGTWNRNGGLHGGYGRSRAPGL